MSKLVLRTCDRNLQSRGGFQYPVSGRVVAPDWDPSPECGKGLHGFLEGEGDGGDLADWSTEARWLVLEVDEYVDLGGKVKFPSGQVVHVGDVLSATRYLQEHGCKGAIIGSHVVSGHRGTSTSGDRATSTSGNYGTSTSGNYGTSTSGYRGISTSGKGGTSTSGDGGTSTSGDGGTSTSRDYGTSTSGDKGTSTSGDYGTSTAGDKGTSTSGDYGTSTSGCGGKCAAGIGGILQIKRWDGSRYRIETAYVGESGIQPNTYYKLDEDGSFVEC